MKHLKVYLVATLLVFVMAAIQVFIADDWILKVLGVVVALAQVFGWIACRKEIAELWGRVRSKMNSC